MDVSETYKRVLSEPVQERTSLGPKMTKLCAQKPIFHVETMEFASGQGMMSYPSGGNETTPVPPPNVGGQSLATRAVDPCHPSGTIETNCPIISWRCCGTSSSCIFRYTCQPADAYGSPPDGLACTGTHNFHGIGWQCIPVDNC
uniref:Aldolase n=1 Tax=Branchiostoma belcheri tsingtauense TaxID=155462 RepID=Q6IT80_BRABE|nr:aldolase [Branchiostoma belcheri tsingtauense]